jgi:hypothetical protein
MNSLCLKKLNKTLHSDHLWCGILRKIISAIMKLWPMRSFIHDSYVILQD